MRIKIAAGNWKMNLTLTEGIELAKKIGESERPQDVLTILGVPSCYLTKISEVLKPFEGIKCAAQNHHHIASGAFTGEISVKMLASMGIEYVILGHSERRLYNQENEEILMKKLLLALEHNLKVIYCCGEPLDVRTQGKHNDFVINQLSSTIFKLSQSEIKNIIIAYEPIWAIGTGKTASSEQAQEMHKNIRDQLNVQFNMEISNTIPILYGGSVKSNNAPEIFNKPDVDGALVGGASLDAEEFIKIIHSF